MCCVRCREELVADDLIAVPAGQHFRRSLLFVFLICDVLGLPLSWNKVSGGAAVSWMGHELLLESASLGVSASRWMRGWMLKLLADKVVRVGDSC